MTDDSHKTEHDLLAEGAPLINQMGIDKGKSRPKMREALKAQLAMVHEGLEQYIPTKPRGYADDNLMPHEWGSMDTYDDMRNSMRFAAMLMDAMLDPFDTEEDELKVLRGVIRESEVGLCAITQEIQDMARGDLTDEQWDEVVYGEEV